MTGERLATGDQRIPEGEIPELIGYLAARPAWAPTKRPAVCSGCGWRGRRYGEYYVHPLGQPETVHVVPAGRGPCPRCGGAVDLGN